MTNIRIVLTTVGAEEEARKIARALVERQLAACVNIVARVRSIYRWQGKVEEAEEWLLVVKTTAENFEGVRAAIGELHPYEVPECLCLAVEDGAAEYLRWIEETTRKKF